MTSPNIGPGNIPNVPGAQPTNLLGMGAHAARGETQWRDQIDGQFKSRANGSGIGSWATSVLSAFSDAFTHISSILDQLGILGGRMDDFVDGQLELNDRTDLLSPLLDYGSCFANGSGEISQIGRVPFNQKVGPMTGCRLESNGIVLEDQGLWQINARLAFSYTIGGGAQTWRIRVYRPNGTLFSEQLDYSSESNENTREMLTTVVVPDAGYRVEVWITALIIGRATIGGPQNNRLTVQHISRSTEFPI
ncbi:hypothetical protein WKY82_09325 [Gordonia malaquae]|uniref:hypothetical protein n=1 Tax=Gordonia malaquae TaxID=410332 RepID=UPI0030C79734